MNRRLENFSEFLHWWFQATKEYRLMNCKKNSGKYHARGAKKEEGGLYVP